MLKNLSTVTFARFFAVAATCLLTQILTAPTIAQELQAETPMRAKEPAPVQPPDPQQTYLQPQSQQYPQSQPQYLQPAYGSGYPSQLGGFAPSQPPNQFGGFQPQAPMYAQPQNYGPGYAPGYGAPPQYIGDLRGSTAYAPQGMVIPITLQTSISTQVAKAGDYIQASIAQNVSLGGYSYIPQGTVAVGQISEATAGRRLSRSGALSIDFNSLRMPNGTTIPISAHLLGSIGKYKDVGKDGQDLYRGEGWGTKAGQFLLRGGLGAGLGAGLGTAVGAIGGGGYGAGMGAWSGAAIGGGIGAADMLLRKGKDVIIPSGTQMQLQLSQQASIPVEAPLGAPQQPPGPSSIGAF